MPLLLKCYDALSGFTCPPSHIMTVRRSHRKFPQLSDHVKYFAIFYEGQHNDARTAVALALTAAEYGATVANYTEMTKLLTDPVAGRATGVVCRDTQSGKEFRVYAKSIVFCAGPFTDALRQMEMTKRNNTTTRRRRHLPFNPPWRRPPVHGRTRPA